MSVYATPEGRQKALDFALWGAQLLVSADDIAAVRTMLNSDKLGEDPDASRLMRLVMERPLAVRACLALATVMLAVSEHEGEGP